MVQTVKNLPAIWETQVQSPGWEDHLEKGIAPHFNIPAWRIPWTEEPGGLLYMRHKESGITEKLTAIFNISWALLCGLTQHG